MPTNASLLVIFLVSICNLTADAQQGVVETCNSSSFFDVEVQIQPGAGDVMLECDQTQEARLQKVIKSVVDSKFAKYYQESMKLSALELVDHCPGASASGGLLDSTTAEVYATLSDCRFCLVAADDASPPQAAADEHLVFQSPLHLQAERKVQRVLERRLNRALTNKINDVSKFPCLTTTTTGAGSNATTVAVILHPLPSPLLL